ncbi:MAG: lysylphosphatidylglycerol synthase transmembrane domain-containing protein [Pseudomonadota bacterium]
MTDETQPQSRRWSRIALRAVGLGLIIGALAFVTNGGQLLALGSSQFWIAYFLAASAALVSLLSNGATIKILNGAPVRYREALSAGALVVALFPLLPSRLSEGLKPLYLSSASGQPFSHGLAALIGERFLDLIVVGCLALCSLALVAVADQSLLLVAVATFWLVTCVGGAGLIVVTKNVDRISALVQRLPVAFLRKLILLFCEGLQQKLKIASLLSALPFVVVTWMFSVLKIYLFVNIAGSIELSLSQILVVFVIATAGLAVAVTPGGIGTFEASFAALLALYGYDLDEGLFLAITFRLAILFPSVCLVAYLVLSGQLDLTRLLAKLRLRRSDAST